MVTKEFQPTNSTTFFTHACLQMRYSENPKKKISDLNSQHIAEARTTSHETRTH